VSTHSTEIQRNIPEEAGVWTLEPEGSVAILTATSANNNVPDRAALLAKLDGAGGGSPKRSVHTSHPSWRLEERIEVTKGNRTEAVDWASLGETHNVTRERRWWSLPESPFNSWAWDQFPEKRSRTHRHRSPIQTGGESCQARFVASRGRIAGSFGESEAQNEGL
jgi:hypothetical protein